MRIRVGLNSGEVVIRTIGNDLHMDYSAVGPTVHLAARMEQMATPGSTRFTSTTLRLVETQELVGESGAYSPVSIGFRTKSIVRFGVSPSRKKTCKYVTSGCFWAGPASLPSWIRYAPYHGTSSNLFVGMRR